MLLARAARHARALVGRPDETRRLRPRLQGLRRRNRPDRPNRPTLCPPHPRTHRRRRLLLSSTHQPLRPPGGCRPSISPFPFRPCPFLVSGAQVIHCAAVVANPRMVKDPMADIVGPSVKGTQNVIDSIGEWVAFPARAGGFKTLSASAATSPQCPHGLLFPPEHAQHPSNCVGCHLRFGQEG